MDRRNFLITSASSVAGMGLCEIAKSECNNIKVDKVYHLSLSGMKKLEGLVVSIPIKYIKNYRHDVVEMYIEVLCRAFCKKNNCTAPYNDYKTMLMNRLWSPFKHKHNYILNTLYNQVPSTQEIEIVLYKQLVCLRFINDNNMSIDKYWSDYNLNNV